MLEEIVLQEKYDLVWVGIDIMLRICDFYLILCFLYLIWMKELLKLKGVQVESEVKVLFLVDIDVLSCCVKYMCDLGLIILGY